MRIQRLKDPPEYQRFVQRLVQDEFPWPNEGKADAGDAVRLVTSKAGRKDLRRAQRFLALWTAQGLYDLFFWARYISSTGDYRHQKYGCQLDRTYLSDPTRYVLFELYRELERLYETPDPKTGRPLLHRCWIYHARRHFKTTSVSDLVAREYFKHPGHAVAFYSKRKKPMATERLGKVRLEFETNRLMMVMAPELFWIPPERLDAIDDSALPEVTREYAKRQGVSWNETEFTLRRSAGGGAATRTDPSGMACGILSGVYTGGGPDWRIYDDVVDNENEIGATADTTVDNWIAAMRVTNPARAPLDLIVGTQWGKSDPYVRMQDQGFIWRTWRRSAVDKRRRRPDFEELGGYEPILLDEQELREQRGTGEKAREGYGLQYLCDVDWAKRRPLDPSLIGTYALPPARMAQGAELYFLMDPGGRGMFMSPDRKMSDTAWAVFANRPGHFALLAGGLDILTPAQRAKLIVDQYELWQGLGCFWAQTGVRIEQPGQNADAELVAAEQERRGGPYFDIYSVHRRPGEEKVERVYHCLEGIIQARRMLFPGKLPVESRGKREDLCLLLRGQLDGFPRDVRNDGPDMMALLGESGKMVYVYRGGTEPRQMMLPPIRHPRRLRTGEAPDRRPRQRATAKFGFLGLGLPDLDTIDDRRAVA